MSFYDPENLTDPSLIATESESRLLQPVWNWIIHGREDFLRSPLFPPALGIIFYIVVTIPFTIVDYCFQNTALVQSFKLHKNRPITAKMILNTYANAFWNHILLIIPLALVQAIWVPPTPLPPVAPTVCQFVFHISMFFILFDFEFWIWHIIHHKVRFLYRWCHSVHHQYHTTFALVTQYMHPWELFYVGLIVSITPWFFNTHCMTYWCWFIVANWVSVEVHCGYDLPWAPHKWCPFYGGAPKHDIHHTRPLTNFQPFLNYLDRIIGWDVSDNLKGKQTNEAGPSKFEIVFQKFKILIKNCKV